MRGTQWFEFLHFPFCMLPGAFFIFKQNVNFIKTRSLFKEIKKSNEKQGFLNLFYLLLKNVYSYVVESSFPLFSEMDVFVLC